MLQEFSYQKVTGKKIIQEKERNTMCIMRWKQQKSRQTGKRRQQSQVNIICIYTQSVLESFAIFCNSFQ